MFSVVEIEVNSRCNRACGYCPNAFFTSPVKAKMMKFSDFQLIIDKIAQENFSGRMSYNLYNEPLLRKDLDLYVGYVRSKIPFAYQLLYTNGDFLSDACYLNLLNAGIDRFVVTRHDFSPIPERKYQVIQYPNDLDITSRGGVVPGLPTNLAWPCYAPTDMLIITATGDVILCHEDSRRSVVMGNLLRESLPDVWLSQEFEKLRNRLLKGDRAGASTVCGRCSHRNYPLPGCTI